MNDKQIRLAKKLLALANKGVGGEKRNAKQMLEAIMEKYNLSMADINGEAISMEGFTYKNSEKKLLIQVIASVMGAKVRVYRKGTANKLYVECTKAEYANILASFEHYAAAYARDLKVHFTAFVNRNDIFPDDADGVDINDMSQEQIDLFHDAEMMMMGMKQQPLPRKRIE